MVSDFYTTLLVVFFQTVEKCWLCLEISCKCCLLISLQPFNKMRNWLAQHNLTKTSGSQRIWQKLGGKGKERLAGLERTRDRKEDKGCKWMNVESQGQNTLIHDFHPSVLPTLLIMPLLPDLQLDQSRRFTLPPRASLCFILSVHLITAALHKYSGPTKKKMK